MVKSDCEQLLRAINGPLEEIKHTEAVSGVILRIFLDICSLLLCSAQLFLIPLRSSASPLSIYPSIMHLYLSDAL